MATAKPAFFADEDYRSYLERLREHVFRQELDASVIDKIREAINGNYALGSKQFEQEVAVALRCRVMRGSPGRPKKVD